MACHSRAVGVTTYTPYTSDQHYHYDYPRYPSSTNPGVLYDMPSRGCYESGDVMLRWDDSEVIDIHGATEPSGVNSGVNGLDTPGINLFCTVADGLCNSWAIPQIQQGNPASNATTNQNQAAEVTANQINEQCALVNSVDCLTPCDAATFSAIEKSAEGKHDAYQIGSTGSRGQHISMTSYNLSDVKDEVRHSIQQRSQFQSQFQGQIHGCIQTYEEFLPYNDYSCRYPSLNEFSQEEFEKRLRRRERNKVAAYKCRMKKKEAGEELKKDYEKLECTNTELKYQVRMLELEKQELQTVLNEHTPVCHRNVQLE